MLAGWAGCGLVSWGCYIAYPWDARSQSGRESSGDRVWVVHCTRAWGRDEIQSYWFTHGGDGVEGTPAPRTVAEQWPDPKPQDVLPSWLGQESLRDMTGANRDQTISAIGFPFRFLAIVSTLRYYHPSSDNNDGHTAGATWHAAGRLRSFRLLWEGAAANTIICALAVLMARALAHRAIVVRRLMRGQCPKCRYSLGGRFDRACPECGWQLRTVPPSQRRGVQECSPR